MSSKEKYILAIDQGTTSCRAILFDNHATAVDSAQQPFEQIYPQHGWVEHSPEVIFDTQLAVIKKVVADTNIDAVQIAALGITNQRETTIVWERATGKPIFNAIVWQCHRTADMCDNLKKRGLEQLVYNKTGLPIDAYFSATKISWILKNVDGARQRAERGELCFGTVDTYLMFRLSCGAIFATDYTNASRTLLFNIHTLQWDDELLQLFDIPKV
ncbi:MAG: FGGY family carbohydrate kinase, partial [Clostridia bacterium]